MSTSFAILPPSRSSKLALADWIFKTLSVIFACSTLVNVMVCRAAVVFQVLQVVIFGPLLLQVSRVDRHVESFGIQVTTCDRQKLLSMKLHQLVDFTLKGFQQSLARDAKNSSP